MSTYTEGSFLTKKAAEDIAAYTVVKTNAAGELVNAEAATDLLLGVVHAAVKAGAAIDVRLRNSAGTAQVQVGTVAVAKDAAITSDANGKAVTATAAAAGAVPTSNLLGYALEAGAAGAVIEFMPATTRI